MDIKGIAKSIRTVLKSVFPATKFSVTISRFSMGESVDVSWMDGPTKTQVNDLISVPCTPLQFINMDRVQSMELAIKAVAAWKVQNSEYAHLVITCKGEEEYYGIELDGFDGNLGIEFCEDSINEFIRNASLPSVNFILANATKRERVLTPQPQPSQLDTLEVDVLEAERKQVYAQYIASWQEADALEAKLTAKRKESQELGEKLEEIKAKIESKRLEKVRAIAPPKVNEITLTRAEDPSLECRKPVTVKVKTFAAADKVLRQWVRTAPDDGAFEKCDISLNLVSGNIHKTRFDLMRSHVFGSQLQQQLEEQLNTKLSSSDTSIWCGW